MNTSFESLRHLTQPGITRSRILRRATASALALAAVLMWLVSLRTEHATAWRYTRDVQAGEVLQEADIAVVHVPKALSSQMHQDEVLGRIVVVDRSAGSLAHGSDVLDPSLQASNVGEISSHKDGASFNIVPLKLVDASVSALLVPGDTVDVISTEGEHAAPQVIAQGARVVFAAQRGDATKTTSGSNTPGVLLQLDPPAAQAVAAASLAQPLTVVVTGRRAQ